MARQPFFIKIPTNCPPDEADRWRTVAEALKAFLYTTNKVDSPTTGLNVTSGKVKVDKYDSTPEYLDQKIVAGSDLDFIESNDGMGAKEIKANFKLAVSDAEPSTITTGMLWFDSDARFGTPFTIGDGETDIDYELKFDGETNDGSIYWMEDEDYFRFADCLKTEGGRKINSVVVTDTYAILATDELVVCNKSTAFSVTLPAASASGRIIHIKNIGLGGVTLDADSSDTIDGITTQVLSQWDSITVADYAANAWVIL